MNSRMKTVIAVVVVVVVVAVAVAILNPSILGSLFGGAVYAGTPSCAIARGCNCPNTNFAGIGVSNLTFNKCDLHGSIFDQGSVAQSKFQGANLKGASFKGTAMGAVDLSDADLTGANLTGALMTNAITTGAIFCKTTMPDGTVRTDAGRSCP